MQISSLLEVLDARLQNEPSISFIYDIKTKASSIKDGDAIISNSQLEITKAIEKGAFGVIYSNNSIKISDTEIAWMKVDDIQKSATKFIRFLLSNTKIRSLSSDFLTFEMMKIFAKSDKKIHFIDDNIIKNFQRLKNISHNDTIICTNFNFLEQIIPTSKKMRNKNYKLKNTTEHSLFEVSFSHKNNFFSRVKLPIIYIKHFLNSVEFFGAENIEQTKIKNFKFLSPIFVNKNFEIVDFGKSDKFIILQNQKLVANDEINFLNSKFTYGKKIFALPKNFKKGPKLDDVIFYSSKDDLQIIVNQNNYNCLYIFGIDDIELSKILKPNYETKSLF